MFATELIQSLITHYNNENGMDNCYILDETQDINKDILKNSQNIVIFRHSLITELDLEKIKNHLSHSYDKDKKISFLSTFLNPKVVRDTLKMYPNIVFFTIFNSSLFDLKIKEKFDETNEEYFFGKDFMDAISMCKLFRQMMFSYIDDNF